MHQWAYKYIWLIKFQTYNFRYKELEPAFSWRYTVGPTQKQQRVIGADPGFCNWGGGGVKAPKALPPLQSVHSNLSSSAASLQTGVCPQHQCTHSWPMTSRDCLPLQARIQDFWKGGGSRRGYRIFHKHPPLGHCPHDVIRPQKIWKTPPLLDIHKHPPLGHCPRDVIRPQKNWNTPTLGHSQKGGVQLWAQC